MVEEKSSDFKIRIDEESPDSVFQDEIRELRLEKLSKRVTILSILIPCLLGAFIAFAYLDLKEKVLINQNTGVKTVQNLSKDFDTRLYDLSGKYNDLENTLANRAAALEKNFSSLKFRLYKNEHRTKKIDAAKAEKKDQEAALKDLKNISSQIDALDKMVAQKLGQLAASIKNTTNDLIKIRADISTLVTSKMDRKIFDQELQKEQQFQQKKLDQIQATMDNQIQSIQKEIKKIENRIALIQKEGQQAPQNPPPSTPSSTSPGSSGKQQGESAIPKSGQIIEKDI